MFKILADTCVWLDMAKEPQQQLLLNVLEEPVKMQEVGILLPRVIIDEFQRNRRRVIEDSRRSLSGVIKRVKATVDRYGTPRSKGKVLDHLNDIDHRLPMLGEEVGNSLARIEKLFQTAEIIETTEAVKLRVIERALQAKAPYHGKKNSTADAILIETYADCVGGPQSTGHLCWFSVNGENDLARQASR